MTRSWFDPTPAAWTASTTTASTRAFAVDYGSSVIDFSNADIRQLGQMIAGYVL